MVPKDCYGECCHGNSNSISIGSRRHLQTPSHGGNGDSDNEFNHQNDKYAKRRLQTLKHRRRIQRSIGLLAVSLVALSITYVAISYSPNNPNGRRLDNIYGGGGGFGKNHHGLDDRSRRTDNTNDHRNHYYPQNQHHHHQQQRGDDGPSFLGKWNPFGTKSNAAMKIAQNELDVINRAIHKNTNSGIRWINMGLVPSIGSHGRLDDKPLLATHEKDDGVGRNRDNVQFFKVRRKTEGTMSWEVEAGEGSKTSTGPSSQRANFVDYSRSSDSVSDGGSSSNNNNGHGGVRYEYPEKLMEPPSRLGDYPTLRSMKEIMEIWPQDNIDDPPSTIVEDLIHFDYTIPEDVEAATKFRDAKLPFKMINVPEVVEAGKKWTDDYLIRNFDGGAFGTEGPPASGTCQESSDNYFAFYTPPVWDVSTMGVPPTRNNDWNFSKWITHADYADRVGLSPYQPHFYWQAGVDRDERYQDQKDWTFISRDLPSFSSTEANFFQFDPESQKGIQCRFGERGVTAATHFDGGRNMVAMIHGAKRYILSPPRECAKLGIVPSRRSAIYRHSMLNFGHINHMDDENMPDEERAWMEFSGTASALSTVVKAGEVLYIPSHWFHYITSLQKSAQCNVRSGIDREGDDVFGGVDDVMTC